MKPIIRVNNLSKRYRVGAPERRRTTLRETLGASVRSPFKMLAGRASGYEQSLWALKDVSFEVEPGEIVGIIGRNGAGKSTLLKILSRITEPTEGNVKLFGRAASLLEVGTGFHPELTGRENIYLNGAILGMKRQEISGRFAEIAAFAEVEKYLDMPVKHYSSGMYMRLAFAVAAHLEPEILVIDEVLAVGDVQFQKKCLGKMGEVARQGRTVLFVSHNMAAVASLCGRGMLLEQGRIKYIGAQTEAIARYLARSGNDRTLALMERTDRAGTGEVRVTSIEIKDTQGRPLEVVASGQDIDIFLHYRRTPEFTHSNVVAGLCVKTQLDVPVFLQHNRLTRHEWRTLPASGAFVCRLRRLPLPPASYRLTYSLMRADAYLDGMEDAFEFSVTAGDFFGTGEVPPATHGCCLVDAEWRLETELKTFEAINRERAAAELLP